MKNTNGAHIARHSREHFEDELKRLRAIIEKVAGLQPFSVVDGRLVTGQNPTCTTVAAQYLLNLLAAVKKAA
jgi:hypothetical protein